MESRYDESNKITIVSIIWNIALTIIKIGAGGTWKFKRYNSRWSTFSI